MLEVATFCNLYRYMDPEPLIKLVILKRPSEIITIVYQATIDNYLCDDLIRAAEGTAWMVFQMSQLAEVLVANKYTWSLQGME